MVIKNPNNREVVVRRVVGTSGEWVQRNDNQGGMSQIPKEHLWVECENNEEHRFDSLTEFGHITSYLITG